MKRFLLTISAISLFAAVIASDFYCFNREWIYHYHNGVLVDSVIIGTRIDEIEKLPQEQRIKEKEFLSTIRQCKGITE